MSTNKEKLIHIYSDFALFLRPFFKNKQEVSNFFDKCFTNKKTKEMWGSFYYFFLAYEDLKLCKSSRNSIAYLNLILIGLAERIHSIRIGKKKSSQLKSFGVIKDFFKNTPEKEKKLIEKKLVILEKSFNQPEEPKFLTIIEMIYDRRNKLAHGEDFWWNNHIFCPLTVDAYVKMVEYGSKKNKKSVLISTSLRVNDLKNIIVKTAIIDIKKLLKIK